MKQKLTLGQIFIYGLPGLPLAMLGLPLFVYLPSYYSQNLGLSLSAVGLALLLARSFDVITDPLIGLLNDRYPRLKSTLWRRKSYVLLGIPLLVIGLNYLLRPPENVTAWYLFIWSFITYLGWTLISIPWHAIGAEISPNYHEKSALASSREIFSVIGTVIVISLPILLSIQLDLKLTLETLANILTLLIPLALLPLLWKLKSNTLKVNQVVSNKQKLFSKETFTVIKHPAIKRLLPAYFFNSFANALPATLFILFVSHILQTPDKIGVLLMFYFFSAIFGIPLWLLIARKTDKHISWCIALMGSIASFIWVPFISEGNFIGFAIVCVVSGFCLGADVVMPASIQADISQHISTNSTKDSLGKDSHTYSDRNTNINTQYDATALLFGLWGLLTKLSLALAIGIAFPLLDFLGLNMNNLEAQINSDNADFTLITLYALIPIILKVWVLTRMWSFPFGKHFFMADLSSQETNYCNSKGKENENTYTTTINRPISLTSSNKRLQ